MVKVTVRVKSEKETACADCGFFVLNRENPIVVMVKKDGVFFFCDKLCLKNWLKKEEVE